MRDPIVSPLRICIVHHANLHRGDADCATVAPIGVELADSVIVGRDYAAVDRA
jgi:hypothetical protein